MNKKWQIYQVEEEKVEELVERYKINKLLATILVNRNIIEKNQVEKFLNPKRNDFYNPYEMPDMEIAVERIIKAIENKEKIIIYGDYDVDGITSVTVLKSFLEERGIEVAEYIPNRLKEGYGLNKTAVEEIAKQKHTLMITVDCGISAIEEVEYASKLGIETIITDHHEPGSELPKAIAVVDAKRKDNKYPFRNLAGVGVVFKLVEQTKNLGLKAILEASGYGKIDSGTISFGVAPRINACGRMGHQEEALKLFLSKEIAEVNELTQKLNEYNKLRQETEKNIYNDAIMQIIQ